MTKTEYWCEYGEHWVSETRLPFMGQPICKQGWRRICEIGQVTECDQVWEKMHKVEQDGERE